LKHLVLLARGSATPLSLVSASFLALCLGTLVTDTASASGRGSRWLKIDGPHFTVYSDGGVKQARQVASQFEAIRDLFHRRWPWARIDPSRPIVILAAKDERSLKALLPEFWEKKGSTHPAGIFVRGEERYYIALRTDLEEQYEAWEENPYQVVYHEYAHLILDLNFGHLPAWLNEGLAEFYGATIIGRAEIQQGRPLRSHIYLLRERTHLPLERLLEVDYGSPEYNEETRATVFYAQSWALVHYFLLGDKGAHAQTFANYVNLLRKDVGEEQAARQAFGDLGKLGNVLEAYVRRFAFTYARGKIGHATAGPELRSRDATEAESQAVRGDFQLSRGRLEAARPLLERALALSPDLAAAHASLGLLDLREDRQEEARRRVSRAVELDSQSFLMHYLHAILNMGPGDTRESLALVEQSLRRSTALNHNFAPAYALLAEVAAYRSGDYRSALPLVRRAVSLEPGVVSHRLAAGRLLSGMGQREEAGLEGKRALAAARSEEDRRAAQHFLDSLAQLPQRAPAPPSPTGAPVETTVETPPPDDHPAPAVAPGAPGPGEGSARPVPSVARGVIVQMSCPPGGALIFVVETRSGRLRLWADAPDLVFLMKSGRPVQMDWQCGALSIPVTVRYMARPPEKPGAAVDGTVVSFHLEPDSGAH
jgi:tetratricopeptide (TPR) repeat protein